MFYVAGYITVEPTTVYVVSVFTARPSAHQKYLKTVNAKKMQTAPLMVESTRVSLTPTSRGPHVIHRRCDECSLIDASFYFLKCKQVVAAKHSVLDLEQKELINTYLIMHCASRKSINM